LKQAHAFLELGSKIKLPLRFCGREIVHKEFGENVNALKRICKKWGKAEFPLKNGSLQRIIFLPDLVVSKCSYKCYLERIELNHFRGKIKIYLHAEPLVLIP
jgi:hypothetical protein